MHYQTAKLTSDIAYFDINFLFRRYINSYVYEYFCMKISSLDQNKMIKIVFE